MSHHPPHTKDTMLHFSSTILSAWEWPIPWLHSPRVSAPSTVPSAGSADAHTHRARREMWPRKISCTRCKIPLTLRRETSRLWWTSAFGYQKSWGVIILVEWPRPFVHVDNERNRNYDCIFGYRLFPNDEIICSQKIARMNARSARSAVHTCQTHSSPQNRASGSA